MSLFDLMLSAECSICLQRLLPVSEGLSSPPLSSSSAGRTPERKPNALLRLLTSWRGGNKEHAREEEEFRITFAPSVLQTHAADRVLTFIDARDMYNRSKKKKKGGLVGGSNADTGSLSSVADQGIVVLPCGHMLHFLCAIQLHEYNSNNATCPICRQELKSAEDFVLFAPRSRPALTPRSDVMSCSEKTHGGSDGEKSGEEEVRFAGERCMAPPDAYRRHIRHETEELKRRRRNLRSREQDLTSSRDKLEEQCLLLELSAEETRRRHAVLTQQGRVGVERLVELRDVARRTHALVNQLTTELASLTRQQVTLDHQLEKSSQKLQEIRLRKRGDSVDVMDEVRVHGDSLSPPLQKRRLRDPVSGVGLSYYASH